MTTISSSLSTVGQSYNMRQSMFSKIDSNSDGSVSKNEFVSSRPKDVSADQASLLFDKIDASGTGALTQEQLEQGLEANRPDKSSSSDSLSSAVASLSSDLLAILNQLSQTTGNNDSDEDSLDAISGAGSKRSTPEEVFSKLDADGDGKVTQAEFVAGKPEGISEDQAISYFNSIDSEGTGSITKDQFASARPAGPSGHGAPPLLDDASSSLTDSSDSSNNSYDNLLEQILNAINNYVSNNSTNDYLGSNALLEV